MRLVLDTCVIVSAFRSRNGASRRLIDAFDAGLFSVLLSQPLLLEYETNKSQTSSTTSSHVPFESVSTGGCARSSETRTMNSYWKRQSMDLQTP
ncbi:MAG: PIN domain-containing protein [Acidobacteriaceae bacterium]